LYPETAQTIPLEPGGLAYIIADTKTSGPILENLNIVEINKRVYRQLLDRTNFITAAIYPQGNDLRFQLSARGRYPVSRIKTFFGFSKYWKKARSPESGMSYRFSSVHRMSVAVNSAQAFVSSFGSAASAAAPYSAVGTEAPEDFFETGKGSALSCWLENPSPMLNKYLEDMGIDLAIPAQRLFISFFPVNNQGYEANLLLQFPFTAQARAIGNLLSMGRDYNTLNEDTADHAAISAPAEDSREILVSILFSNPPVHDDKNLTIKTNALSVEEISLLFDMFSL